MTEWDRVADELEARVEAAEGLLASGGAAPDPSDGGPLPVPRPPGPPTPAQRRRLAAIEQRAGDVRQRLRDEMARVGAELAASGRRRGAARTYGRSSRLGSDIG